jgi:hypothetical protein
MLKFCLLKSIEEPAASCYGHVCVHSSVGGGGGGTQATTAEHAALWQAGTSDRQTGLKEFPVPPRTVSAAALSSEVIKLFTLISGIAAFFSMIYGFY